MIVWPVTSSSTMTANSSAALDRGRPIPGDAQRRQDDEDDQHHELDPEAAEAGAALRLEVLALVLDRPVVTRGGAAASGRPPGRRWRRRGPLTAAGLGLLEVGRRAVGHEAQRYAGPAYAVVVGAVQAGSAGRLRPGAARSPARRRSPRSAAPAGSPAVAMTFHDREPPPRHDPVPVHDPGIDPDRQARPAARTR